MNLNWRDVLINRISIDEVVGKITGLGVPGLVLLMAMVGSPWYGGAAIMSGLAGVGGPFGAIGGIGVIVLSGFLAAVFSRFGFERIFKRVLKKLIDQGKTKEEILREIDGYRITKELKLKLRDYIENMEFEEMDEPEETELTQEMQQVSSITERLIDEALERLESRLNSKNDDVKKDFNDRMDRAETELKRFIVVAVAVGTIITSSIVALIVIFSK